MSDKVPEIGPGEFGGRLVLAEHGIGYWKLQEAITFRDSSTSELVHRAPAGFVTDLASIPRIMWSWMPPFGSYSRAGNTPLAQIVISAAGPINHVVQ